MANGAFNNSLHNGMSFYHEAQYLPKRWESLAIALMEYAKHISKSEPQWENEQWVFCPENFVTFRIQHNRKTGLTIYLRGTEDEFPSLRDRKTVVKSVPGYSKIIVDDFEQAPEAFFAVNRAYELYLRGRRRRKKSLTVQEITYP